MKTFKDSTGREWNIEFTIGSLLRISKEFGHDLMEPERGNLGARLASDIVFFWEALWHIVSPQAAEAGITAEQFGKAMHAENLTAAQDAFFEEWPQIFHSFRQPSVAKSIEQIHTLKLKSIEILRKTLAEDRTIQDFPQAFADQMEADLHAEMAKLPAILRAAMNNEELVSVQVVTPAQ